MKRPENTKYTWGTSVSLPVTPQKEYSTRNGVMRGPGQAIFIYCRKQCQTLTQKNKTKRELKAVFPRLTELWKGS